MDKISIFTIVLIGFTALYSFFHIGRGYQNKIDQIKLEAYRIRVKDTIQTGEECTLDDVPYNRYDPQEYDGLCYSNSQAQQLVALFQNPNHQTINYIPQPSTNMIRDYETETDSETGKILTITYYLDY